MVSKDNEMMWMDDTYSALGNLLDLSTALGAGEDQLGLGLSLTRSELKVVDFPVSLSEGVTLLEGVANDSSVGSDRKSEGSDDGGETHDDGLGLVGRFERRLLDLKRSLGAEGELQMGRSLRIYILEQALAST